jgi:ABC-type oligopeptide transport system substrate-binding subunit
MKGSHLFWLSRSKGMTVDIWIGDYNPPRCFQKKISGRSKHNGLYGISKEI